MYEGKYPKKRYKYTLHFLKENIDLKASILDLGVSNPFSELLKSNGFNVTNTLGEDLDLDTTAVETQDYDVVTAFEIFEHLVSPFNVINQIKAKKHIKKREKFTNPVKKVGIRPILRRFTPRYYLIYAERI
jgi:hypothetical protein